MNKFILILIFLNFSNYAISMELDDQNCSKQFPFSQLPCEIQSYVLFFTCYNTKTLFESLKVIQNLRSLNKFFFELMDQKYIAKIFINDFNNRFGSQITKNIPGLDRIILLQIIPGELAIANLNNNLDISDIDYPEDSNSDKKEENECNQTKIFGSLVSLESDIQLISQEKRNNLLNLIGEVYIASLLETSGSKEILKRSVSRDMKFISDLFIALCAQPNSDKVSDKLNLKLIENLLNESIDANYIDQFGITALMKSCASGNFTVAELLLDKGAYPNIRTRKSGYTALMITVSNWISLLAFNEEEEPDLKEKSQRFKNTINLLLEKGADPNLENNKKLSMLNLVEIFKRGLLNRQNHIGIYDFINNADLCKKNQK